MERTMAYNEDQKQDGMFIGDLEVAVRRASHKDTCPGTGEHAAGSDRLARPEQRYERFEPITVRAATRVLHLQRAGVVSAKEAAFYLSELAAMDAHAGKDSFQSLVRAAQRCAATRPVDGPRSTGRRPRRRAGSPDLRAFQPALELPLLA